MEARQRARQPGPLLAHTVQGGRRRGQGRDDVPIMELQQDQLRCPGQERRRLHFPRGVLQVRATEHHGSRTLTT